MVGSVVLVILSLMGHGMTIIESTIEFLMMNQDCRSVDGRMKVSNTSAMDMLPPSQAVITLDMLRRKAEVVLHRPTVVMIMSSMGDHLHVINVITVVVVMLRKIHAGLVAEEVLGDLETRIRSVIHKLRLI